MQIHQMSVTYMPEQDRILMRINTTEGEEMRMWLTRRLMVGLWPLLTKLLTEHLLKLESAGASLAGANPELKKMLADFRKEEFLQSADFETPAPAPAGIFPSGRRTARANRRVVTSISIKFIAQRPRRSSECAASQLGSAISAPPRRRTRGRSSDTAPP